MAQWWRHPPDRARFITILVAVGLSLTLVLIERTVGWPDWLHTQPVPIHRAP